MPNLFRSTTVLDGSELNNTVNPCYSVLKIEIAKSEKVTISTNKPTSVLSQQDYCIP